MRLPKQGRLKSDKKRTGKTAGSGSKILTLLQG